MEQFPSSPHFYIFPLGECCVRANVRILSAFLGTRDALCYKKTFKKDSTFSARHAALSNSWQGLANTPARTHSSAINRVVPTHEHFIKHDMEFPVVREYSIIEGLNGMNFYFTGTSQKTAGAAD
ncbi:unnamed protein product [Leuciscus chuanchicus]